MRVLVTGGAGYIGSVVTEELVNDGHDVVVYDSLYKGHREAVVAGATLVQGDLADAGTLRKALSVNRIEAVVHMAADSLVGESCAQPAKYYQNNVTNGLILLDAMREASVNHIVFSSTAATYGEPDKQPMEETSKPTDKSIRSVQTRFRASDALVSRGLRPELRRPALFQRGGSERKLRRGPCARNPHHSYYAASGFRHARVRRRLWRHYPTPDGTCVRDYIHVIDLARAHILALQSLLKGGDEIADLRLWWRRLQC